MPCDILPTPLPETPHRVHYRETLTMSSTVVDVRTSGVGVLRGVFRPEEVAETRRAVLEHRDLLRNTRPTPTAGHLAGFHRYASLEPVHTMLSQDPRVQA